MESEINIRRILSDLWYQHPSVATTMEPCLAKGCQNHARDGGLCPRCLIKAGGRLIGEEHTQKLIHYNSLIVQLRRIENDLVEASKPNASAQSRGTQSESQNRK